MNFVDRIAAPFAWIGRQGTRGLVVCIIIGLLVPPLAAAFRPYVGETVFVMLTLAFLRVDPTALRNVFAAPLLITAATAWIMLGIPSLMGLIYLAFGLHVALPSLFLILILQSATSPITSSPAIAALMGLDTALSLAVLIVCIVITPVTAPAFVYMFTGSAQLSPLELGVKLFAFLAGGALLASAIGYGFGRKRLEEGRPIIDGLAVISMLVFAIASMERVGPNMLSRPLFTTGLIVLTVSLSLSFIVVTALIFRSAGREKALALGILAANRNMGVMIAVIGSTAPELIWLYFGLAQLPIYLVPAALAPVVRRWSRG